MDNIERDDAIAAYTSLRVFLLAEIDHTAETTHEIIDGALREIDRTRLAEARAQLKRVQNTLILLKSGVT